MLTTEYAIDLIVSAIESTAEDDLNEDGLVAEADHRPACDLAIQIAHAIKANPAAALGLVGEVIGIIGLTTEERRYLTMHARYEADRQLDARTYDAGVYEDGLHRLHPDWHTRHIRSRRWRDIADALHPDPWDTVTTATPTTTKE